MAPFRRLRIPERAVLKGSFKCLLQLARPGFRV